MLADLGADVIHVEERDGEWTRWMESYSGQPLMWQGRHIEFELFNHNKRGMAVDVKKAEGREIMHRLASKADVFLTNYRQEAAVRLGLDYETIRQHNPQIVYTTASALGPEGPDAAVPGYEMIGNARGGVMLTMGEEKEPVFPTGGMGDRLGAVYTAYATLAAIMCKIRFGIGQKVTTSQLGAWVDIQGWSTLTALFFNSHSRFNHNDASNPVFSCYKCKDGMWLALGVSSDPRTDRWQKFCHAIDMPQLYRDPKFQDDRARAANNHELISILDKVFATKTLVEWLDLLRKYDLDATKVNRLEDLASDPQVLANRFIVPWDHPQWGKINFLGFPFNMSETPPSLRSSYPEVGQHNEEVLLELGYEWDEIARLRDNKVI